MFLLKCHHFLFSKLKGYFTTNLNFRFNNQKGEIFDLFECFNINQFSIIYHTFVQENV